MAITLGELVVRIKGDATPYRDAVGQVRKESAGLTDIVAAVKGALVDTFTAPAVRAAEFGVEAAGAVAAVAAEAPALLTGMGSAAEALDEAADAAEDLAQAEEQASEAAGDAAKEIKDAGDQAKDAGEKGSSAFRRLGERIKEAADRALSLEGVIKSVIAAVSVKKLWDWAIVGNAEMEQYRETLTVILKDQEKAIQMLAWAEEFAAKTPFDTKGVIEGTVQLESYGLAAQKWLPAIGDMAKIMGKDVNQAIEAVGQATVGNLRSLRAFGILESDLLAAGMKKNAQGQVEDMGNLMEALMTVMTDRFEGGMDRASRTFFGLWNDLTEQAVNFGKKLGGDVFEQRIKPTMERLLNLFERLKETGQLDRWAAIVSIALTQLWDILATGATHLSTFVGWLATGGKWLIEHRQLVGLVAGIILTAFIPAMLAAAAAMAKDAVVGAVNLAAKLAAVAVQYGASAAAAWSAAAGFAAANAPIIITIGVVAALIAILTSLVRNWDDVKDACKRFVTSIVDYFVQLKNNVQTLIGNIGDVFKAFGRLVVNLFNPKERDKAWAEFTQSITTLKNTTVKTLSDAVAPIGKAAESAADAAVKAMEGAVTRLKALFAGEQIDFDDWLKKNGFDPGKLAEIFSVPEEITQDRVGAEGGYEDPSKALRERLELFEELKARNDELVDTYQKQADWLAQNVLSNRELNLTLLERADIEDRIFQIMLARYQETAAAERWTAAEQLKNLDEYVAAYANSFDQVQRVVQMRRDLERRAAEDVAKAQDASFRAALENYDRETRGLDLSAAERRAIYTRLVVGTIAEAERSAETQKAIDLALLDFERELAKNRVALAQEQAALANSLRLREIEAEQGKTARELEEARQTMAQRIAIAGDDAQLRAAIEADYQRTVDRIREEAAKADMRELLTWTDALIKSQDIEAEGQIAALRTVQDIAAQKGVVVEGLAERIRELVQKQRNDETAAAQATADRLRDLYIQELEVRGHTLDASIERERLALDKALRAHELTEGERTRLVALTEARIAQIRQDAREQEERERTQSFLSWARQYLSHEQAMGRITEEQQAAGLRAALQTLDARSDEAQQLAREIEILEKRIADRAIEQQQRVADEVADLLAERLALQGKTLEADIAREMNARQRALRDEALTAEARELIVANSEAHIIELRQDARDQEAADLESWTRNYMAHQIAMGRATEENLLAALREVLRINAELGADTEALARELDELEKRLADTRITEAQRAADRLTELLAERLELQGRSVDAAIAKELASREQALRQTGLSEQERQLIVSNSEARIAEMRRSATQEQADDLQRWAEEYIGHQIAMGEATKANLAGALREVLRINQERGADSEALVRKLRLLERELATESARAAQESADYSRMLWIEAMELRGDLLEAQIEREKLALEQSLRNEALTAEQRVQLQANTAARIAAIQERAQEEEKSDLESWAKAYIGHQIAVGRATEEQLLAALRVVLERNRKRGEDTTALAREIELLEKRIADTGISEQRRQSDELADLLATRMELAGQTLEAAIAREMNARERALRDEKLTAEMRALIVENSEARIAQLRQDAADKAKAAREAQEQELVGWFDDYIGHELALGNITKQNQLDGLRMLATLLDERSNLHRATVKRIELLEKELADTAVAEDEKAAEAARRKADRTVDLHIEALRLQGEELEAAIQQELAQRERSLRDAQLTEEQRAQIVANSEARIAEIREEARRTEGRGLLAWTEEYIGHQISMGEATKGNLLAALREVQRQGALRGEEAEALARRIQRLEKELADDTVRANQEAADTTRMLWIEAMQLRGDLLEAQVERERLAMEQSLRNEQLTADQREQIVANSEAKIEQLRAEARAKEAADLAGWAKTYLGHQLSMGRITEEQQLAGWRKLKELLDERGESTGDLAREIELLEKRIADAAIAEQQRAQEQIRTLQIQRLELVGRATEAAIARIEADRDKALAQEGLTEQARRLIVSNSEQQIAAIKREVRDKEAQELVSWFDTYIGHELQLGSVTKENQLDGLRALQAILQERGVSHEAIARRIQLLEKETADAQAAEAQRAADAIQDLLIQRMELEQQTQEAAILRAEADRDRRLRDQDLTPEERTKIEENAELQIAQIRRQFADQRVTDMVAEFDAIMRHRQALGEATQQDELAGLQFLQRVLAQMGLLSTEQAEALARRVAELAKRVSDEATAEAERAAEKAQRSADRTADLWLESLELQGDALEAAIQREMVQRERNLRDAELTEAQRAQIVANSEERIAQLRSEAAAAASKDRAQELESWAQSYLGHEAAMGRITQEQLLAGLKAALSINAERGEDTEALARTIERLERDIADATITEQRRAQDAITELHILRTRQAGDELEAAIAQIELQRDQRLRDEKLTAEERRLITAQAEEDITRLRKEARDKDTEELISWTKEYIGHEIAMGRASKENLLRGLRAVQEILAERGIHHKALADDVELLEKEMADAGIAYAAARYQFLRDIGVIGLREHIAHLEEQLASEELTKEKRLELARELHREKQKLAEEERTYSERLQQYLVDSGRKSVDEQLADMRAAMEALQLERQQAGLDDLRLLEIDEELLGYQQRINQLTEAQHEYRRQLGEIGLEQHAEWLEAEYEAEAENTERKRQLYLALLQTREQIADAERALSWAQYEYEAKLGQASLDDAIRLQQQEVARHKAGTLERIQAESKLYDYRRQKAEQWLAQLEEQHDGDALRLREILEAELERWEAAGEAGIAYVQVIKRALKDLKDSWDRTWAVMLSGVLSGQQAPQDALLGAWRQQVQQVATGISEGMVEAFAKAKAAGQGVFTSLGAAAKAFMAANLILLAINEIIGVFTTYSNTQQALRDQERTRREQDADHEQRLRTLLDDGFTRSNTHRQEVLTEQAKYLFGLISVTHRRTIHVLSEDTKKWIERIEGYLGEFAGSASGAMDEALRYGTAGEGWRFFLRGLREGIYEQVVDAVIDAFTSSQLVTRAIAPFVQTLDEALMEATADGAFDAARFEQLMAPALAGLEGQLAQLEGPFEAIHDMLRRLREEMRIPVELPGSRGGIQVSEITGPTRDLFVAMLGRFEGLGDWGGILDAIRLAIERMADLAQTDGLRVRLPALVGASGAGEAGTSIGVQWNVDKLEVAVADGVIADPQGLFERLAGEAGRAGDRLKG
jgi:hypothetical protein